MECEKPFCKDVKSAKIHELPGILRTLQHGPATPLSAEALAIGNSVQINDLLNLSNIS